MEKVLDCVGRIRIIKDINYGIITNEQIQELFIFFDLNEEQKRNVFAVLEADNIVPICENEIPQKIRGLKKPSKHKVIPKDSSEQSKYKTHRKFIEKILNDYREKSKDNPYFEQNYQERIGIFIREIIAQKDIIERSAHSMVMRAAIIAISNWGRPRKRICGTYINRVMEHYESWLRIVFPEEELSELVDCIVEGKELNRKQVDMVRVLIYKAPKGLQNCYSSNMCDNEDLEIAILEIDEQ